MKNTREELRHRHRHKTETVEFSCGLSLFIYLLYLFTKSEKNELYASVERTSRDLGGFTY